MPNWVMNEITVTGNENDLRRFLKHVKSDESDFDFNKIVTMPKSLDVDCSSKNAEDIYWFMSDRGAYTVDEIKQRPLSKLITNGYTFITIEDIAKRVAENEEKPSYNNGAMLCQNYVLHGATTWYDWRIANWGTKWNADEPSVWDNGNDIDITFNTAWSMPEKIFTKLCKDFPNLEFEGRFADEDLGNNCGTWWNDNGNFCMTYIDTVEFACEVWGYDPDEYDY